MESLIKKAIEAIKKDQKEYAMGLLEGALEMTGKKPAEIYEDSIVDPTIREDTGSKNIEIARTYEPIVEKKVEPVVIKPKVDYSKLTLAELKVVAKEKGLVGFSALSKAELIEKLNVRK